MTAGEERSAARMDMPTDPPNPEGRPPRPTTAKSAEAGNGLLGVSSGSTKPIEREEHDAASTSSSMLALSQGGSVEVVDYGDQVVVEVTFGHDRDNISIESMELSGRVLQIVVRERYRKARATTR